MYCAKAIIGITTDENISKQHAMSQLRRYNHFSDGNWLIVDKICNVTESDDYTEDCGDGMIFQHYYVSARVKSNIPINLIAGYDMEYADICANIYHFE